MNTKYIVIIIGILVIGGGALFFVSSNREYGSMPETVSQNPLGDDARIVGAISENTPEQSTGTSTTPASAGVTRAMIALHNTEADCWVGYKGIAYDLTNFLPKHPGSAAAIAPHCGTVEEFTAALNRKHGTSKDGFIGKVGTVEGSISQ